MSAQSAIYNPSQTTSAATGDGFSVPRLTTTGRLAIVFGTSDAGMMVYDTTLDNLFIWTGAAWESVPASGDAGANGSVQYNDNGVVSGASNFIYDKATSAVSITGDLTVRSGNKLILNRADNAISSQLFDAGGGAGLTVNNLNGDGFLLKVASNNVYQVSSAYVQTWYDGAGGTLMTLNSTGLGVGTVPSSYKFEVGNGGSDTRAIFNPNNAFSIGVKNGANQLGGWIGSAGNNILTFSGNDGTMKVTIDNTGNVGVGVTPSAWTTVGVRAIDILSGGLGVFNGGITHNAYFDSTDTRWEYKANGAATYYNLQTGIHQWFVAASGTANNPITTFATAAMTLDASGNLSVGATPTGDRRLEIKSAGTSNTSFAAHFRDSADTLLFHVRSDGYFNTGQGTLSPYNNTTASAANMFVDSSGFVYRSTSSLKYKTDVKDSIHGLADVLKLRSVTYKAKNGDDTVFGGLIAEEVHAAGLTEFVAYAPDKTPDSINYGNMVALLVSAIKELTARVQTLEAR